VTTLQLLIICGTVLLLAVLAAAAFAARPESAEDTEPPDAPAWPPAGATVVVHTVDERSVRGIVVEGAGHVALQGAQYLDNGAAQPMGGIVAVPLGNVGLVQVLSVTGDEPLSRTPAKGA
jgi:hypothetical protein